MVCQRVETTLLWSELLPHQGYESSKRCGDWFMKMHCTRYKYQVCTIFYKGSKHYRYSLQDPKISKESRGLLETALVEEFLGRTGSIRMLSAALWLFFPRVNHIGLVDLCWPVRWLVEWKIQSLNWPVAFNLWISNWARESLSDTDERENTFTVLNRLNWLRVELVSLYNLCWPVLALNVVGIITSIRNMCKIVIPSKI